MKRKPCPVLLRERFTEEEAALVVAAMTKREREILREYCLGGYQKVAADRLGIARRTVDNTLQRVRQWADIRHLPQLVTVAVKGGLL